MFQLRLLTGASLCGGLAQAAAPAAVWLCASISVYVLNGVTDVDEDRVNGSRRPIAAGLLSRLHGARGAAALAVVACAGAAVQSPTLLLLTVVLLGLGAAYSLPPVALKRWTGGVAAIAILGGAATYAVGAVVGAGAGAGFFAFAALLTGWMAVVGALTKDLPDADGDRAAGRRTLAGVHGQRTARRAAALAGTVFAVGAPLVAWCSDPQLLPAALVLTIGGTAVAVLALGPWSHGSRDRRRRPYRAFMFTQYAAHAVMLMLVAA